MLSTPWTFLLFVSPLCVCPCVVVFRCAVSHFSQSLLFFAFLSLFIIYYFVFRYSSAISAFINHSMVEVHESTNLNDNIERACFKFER
jgi:small neutral amino acid transporter SnatA (MarC family)